MRSGAIQGIPHNIGLIMISMSADPARFPQSSHFSVASCCARCAVLVVGLSTHTGNATAGAVFSCSAKVDNLWACRNPLTLAGVIMAGSSDAASTRKQELHV